MISTLNIAKCVGHYVCGCNTFTMIRLSTKVLNRSFTYMNINNLYGLSSSIPVTAPKENAVLLNIFKCLSSAIRSYSSKFSHDNGICLVAKHDPVGKEFFCEVAGLGIARLRFERRNQLIILKHTDVPNQLGGRGIGKLLAKEALEYAVKNGLQLEIQCPFIRHYVSQYEPKYIKYIKK